MRFVPFIGSLIAAFFPIALAAAVDPGWTMAIAVAGLFLVSEPVAGHVIEPVLYGQHTGLSPVAIVISTLFWTLLWGPIGLLLATPLTVCLVVLGKHIEALQFIEVLLGDEPALEPHERFYQRLLAGDDTEAADMAESQLKKQSLSAYYDAVAMPALALAQTAAAQGKLSHERQLEIFDTVEEVVEDLNDYDDKDPAAEEDAPSGVASVERESLQGKWRAAHPILCVASRSPLDQAACVMLAQLLEKAWPQRARAIVYRRRVGTIFQNRRIRCTSGLLVILWQRRKSGARTLPDQAPSPRNAPCAVPCRLLDAIGKRHQG
jgi:hypothetical protein